MRIRLIPREERFFDMFAEDAENVLKGARRLEEMLRTYDDVERRAEEIEHIEHHGDELSHAIARKLNSTFVTPFDREDIYALVTALDDILDGIEETADTFVLYKVDAPTATAIEQAAIIVKQCEQLHGALSTMKSFKGLQKRWIEVHRLENEGDQLSRAAVAGLFANGMSATDIIRWKDIYGILETTVDRCEDVADILEKIVLKHA